ncbi:malonate transporter subunit MadL [Azospirillum sp. TSO35-2]|uniref:malonate transporter subunit MadL n=1 Tax=Azospirillum sp. TSO35-2 TaxID=716796 RepID=UPI000D618D12|nr:malonate transporter subunit MadL [Azospirillum sp. TSO35-2]PWC36042.1 malonate transporter [Azospirillum sp. TSO35-2]
MIIYGVMVLGLCMFVGTAIGLTLGILLGIPSDIGGVGFAMLLLVFVTPWVKSKGWLPKASEDGIMFWNAMYIPVVIAMAATQNVAAALSGGWIAFIAGILSVVVCFALIRPLAAMAGAATSSFGDEAESTQS